MFTTELYSNNTGYKHEPKGEKMEGNTDIVISKTILCKILI